MHCIRKKITAAVFDKGLGGKMVFLIGRKMHLCVLNPQRAGLSWELLLQDFLGNYIWT